MLKDSLNRPVAFNAITPLGILESVKRRTRHVSIIFTVAIEHFFTAAHSPAAPCIRAHNFG